MERGCQGHILNRVSMGHIKSGQEFINAAGNSIDTDFFEVVTADLHVLRVMSLLCLILIIFISTALTRSY